MEGISLKIAVIGLIVLLAVMIGILMVLIIRYGRRSLLSRVELSQKDSLIDTLESHADSQDRLISLLKSRHTAGD